jgi:hypothetical protein
MEGFSMPRFYRITVDLFSPDEHAVLANWLGVRPPKVAKGIEPDEAIARMGFETEPRAMTMQSPDGLLSRTVWAARRSPLTDDENVRLPADCVEKSLFAGD